MGDGMFVSVSDFKVRCVINQACKAHVSAKIMKQAVHSNVFTVFFKKICALFQKRNDTDRKQDSYPEI